MQIDEQYAGLYHKWIHFVLTSGRQDHMWNIVLRASRLLNTYDNTPKAAEFTDLIPKIVDFPYEQGFSRLMHIFLDLEKWMCHPCISNLSPPTK